MTGRDELSPESRALLGAARGGDEPRAEDRERVRARMIAAIGAGAAGTAGGAGAATAARETAVAAGAGGGTVATSAFAAKLAAVVLGLAVAATGAFVALREPARPAPEPTPVATPPPRPEPVATLTPAPEPEPVLEPEPEGIPEAEPAPAPRRKRVARPAPDNDAASSVPAADSLREERNLLARATRALRDGDGDAALEALAEHQERFPRGLLVEERSATRVLALCAAGKPAESARARDRFLAAWPRSVHGARVQSACVD